MKKFVVMLLALLMVVLTGCESKKEEAAAPAPAAEKKIKAGFVYVGPIGDGGWTYAHNEGRLAMEKLPNVEPSTYIESVPEGAESARVINSLVQKGHNLIFTTSFGYMDATIDVARKNPNVIFMHCSGYKSAENVGTYFGRMYEPRYLSGIVAGKMTKSNVIGYVAAFPIPEVVRGINAFTLGVKSVNPNATVKVVWTQTWFDPGLERDAADSLLDVGADVLAMHQDTTATLQAAEARGAYAIGYNTDMKEFAPKAYLTSPIWNWAAVYERTAKAVQDGTWKSEQIWDGMKQDLVRLAPMSELVPADVQALVNDATAKIVAGELNVFAGPIVDQDGKEVVAAGVVPADGDLLGMNYFVQGVQGTLPK